MPDPRTHDTVLDPAAERLGHVYAEALIGAAKSQNVADDVVSQLFELAFDVLPNNDALAGAFASPRIDAEEKARVIDRLFGDAYHPVLTRLLKVMARRGRLGHVDAVARAAEAIHDDMMGRVVASVRTAVPLSDELRSQITGKLGQTLGREVRLRESVDDSLIGGMVIRIGDRVYDSSVSNRLNQLTRKVQAGFAAKLLGSFDRFAEPDSAES